MKVVLSLVLIVFLTLSACSFNNKYSQLENKLVSQQAQLDTLYTVTEDLRKSIDKIDNSNKQKLEQLNDKIADLSSVNTRIDNVENEISILEQKLQEQKEFFIELLDTSRTDVNTQPEPVTPATAEELYDYALQLHRNGHYQKSIEKFTLLIHDYPNCDLIANAYYWNGENYFSLEQYETAMFNFDKVIQNYPNCNKVVDSKLKIALCLIGMKEYAGALTQLEKIKKNHPTYSKLNIVDEKIQWLKQQ